MTNSMGFSAKQFNNMNNNVQKHRQSDNQLSAYAQIRVAPQLSKLQKAPVEALLYLGKSSEALDSIRMGEKLDRRELVVQIEALSRSLRQISKELKKLDAAGYSQKYQKAIMGKKIFADLGVKNKLNEFAKANRLPEGFVEHVEELALPTASLGAMSVIASKYANDIRNGNFENLTDHTPRQDAKEDDIIIQPIYFPAESIVILVALVVVVLALFAFFSDSDTQVLEMLEDMTDAQIAIQPLSWFRRHLTILLEDFTGYDDERGIIRMIEAVDCEKLEDIFEMRSDPEIYGNISEIIGAWICEDVDDSSLQRRLASKLIACGLPSPHLYEDDITIAILSSMGEAQIAAYDNATLHALLRNLLQARTNDAEEVQIWRVFTALIPDRRCQILAMPGTSWDDFDDNVHGQEWRWLRPLISMDCDS